VESRVGTRGERVSTGLRGEASTECVAIDCAERTPQHPPWSLDPRAHLHRASRPLVVSGIYSCLRRANPNSSSPQRRQSVARYAVMGSPRGAFDDTGGGGLRVKLAGARGAPPLPPWTHPLRQKPAGCIRSGRPQPESAHGLNLCKTAILIMRWPPAPLRSRRTQRGLLELCVIIVWLKTHIFHKEGP
jgi:hypothetical protein